MAKQLNHKGQSVTESSVSQACDTLTGEHPAEGRSVARSVIERRQNVDLLTPRRPIRRSGSRTSDRTAIRCGLAEVTRSGSAPYQAPGGGKCHRAELLGDASPHLKRACDDVDRWPCSVRCSLHNPPRRPVHPALAGLFCGCSSSHWLSAQETSLGIPLSANPSVESRRRPGVPPHGVGSPSPGGQRRGRWSHAPSSGYEAYVSDQHGHASCKVEPCQSVPGTGRHAGLWGARLDVPGVW